MKCLHNTWCIMRLMNGLRAFIIPSTVFTSRYLSFSQPTANLLLNLIL